MTAAKLQRFDFGMLRDFRAPVVPRVQKPVTETPPPPPPPVYDEAQYESAKSEAKKAGYQEGFAAGDAEATARQEAQTKHCEQSLIHMAEQLINLDARYEKTLAAQSKEVSELAVIIAKKVAGDALDARAEEAIVGFVASCLPVVLSKPKLVIELHPDTLPKTESRLREYLAAKHYEGELIFRANITLAAHDARIDWVLGHAERSTAALWQEIDARIRTIPTSITFHPTGD